MMHRLSTHRRAMPLAVLAVLASGAVSPALILSTISPCLAIPLPPPRPRDLPAATPFNKAAPEPSSPGESKRPGENKRPDASNSPASNVPAERTPVDLDVNSLPLFNLPPASRERMRECGEAWRNLKLAGQSDGLIWRSFAQKCLSR
jgi:hypothetical protein